MNQPSPISSALAHPVVKLLSAGFFGQLIGLAFLPIITRLYTKESLGVFASVYAMAAAFAVLLTLKMELILFQRNNRHSESDVLRAACTLGSVTAVFCSLLIAVLAYTSDSLDSLTRYAAMGCALGLSMATLSFAQTVANYRRMFTGIAKSRVGFTTLSNLLAVLLGLLITSTGFIFALANSIAAILVSLVWLKGCSPRFEVSPAKLMSVGRQHWKYCLYLSLSSWAALASNQLIPLLLIFFYPPEYVGMYYIATRIISPPTVLIATAFSDYLKAESLRFQGNAVGGLYLRTGLQLTALAGVILVLIWSLPAWALSAALGDGCERLQPFLMPVAALCASRMIASPLSVIYIYQAKTGSSFAWTLAISCASVLSLLVIGALQLEFTSGIQIHSACVACIYLMYGLCSYRRSRVACGY